MHPLESRACALFKKWNTRQPSYFQSNAHSCTKTPGYRAKLTDFLGPRLRRCQQRFSIQRTLRGLFVFEVHKDIALGIQAAALLRQRLATLRGVSLCPL